MKPDRKKIAIAFLAILLAVSGLVSCGSSHTPTTDREILSALIEGWTEDFGTVTLTIQGLNYGQDDFFTLLDTAEVNSSGIPCEAAQVSYRVLSENGELQTVEFLPIFPLDAESLKAKQNELREAVRAAKEKISKQGAANAEELCREIFDYVISGTVYDDALEAATLDRSLSGEMYVNRSAYGALVTGSTICNGYSRAFKAICDEFDVPCWVVLGTKGGQAHAWNLVLIDGSPFYVDCTRADVNGETENAFLFNERSLEEQGYEISPAIIVPGRE